MRRAGRAVVAALCAATLSACADYGQLAYVRDNSVSFTSPAPRSLAVLPLTLRWVDRRARPAAAYAVFVDAAPVRPGRSLRDVAGRDVACRRNPLCPDPAYLAERGVYVTTVPELALTSVGPLTSKEEVQLHDVVVVLLDAAGHRIGESAWDVEFRLRKRTFG